ncbi:hypothetical protein BOW50_09810 [Solemya velum gill symbiont]|nr:hypothetical protein BOW38_09905 [Solemya velum gill symbiont]OOZ50931.1 hypothetical protein BOW40_09250 [Solemya velum gill symbiont]OOZ53549.1 hypothetical protein BOW41_09530 [Solemya velum gill symbiont]OOZ58375.1 hypothetical protein BOW43_10320 [Solemya velum gill symbiont]OOZ60813.1 hypothetical protein BOW44_09500 [Solemya velum gill symbiont]
MAKAAGGKRVVLQLDPRVAFESLILNRLERIPEGRRQEWLRGLLVLRYECQTLRVAQDEIDPLQMERPQGQGVSTSKPRSAFAAWLAEPVSRSDTATKTNPVMVEEHRPGSQGKPFAGLRKVIG